MGFELPCWESRQPGFTAVGALGWSHVHLTLPQLFERQGIAGMPHQWLLIKIHKMIYMSRHPSRSSGRHRSPLQMLHCYQCLKDLMLHLSSLAPSHVASSSCSPYECLPVCPLYVASIMRFEIGAVKNI